MKKYCNKHYCCYEAYEGCKDCEPEDLVGPIVVTKVYPIESLPIPNMRWPIIIK